MTDLSELSDEDLEALGKSVCLETLKRAYRDGDYRGGSCRLFPTGCECRANCQPGDQRIVWARAKAQNWGVLEAFDEEFES